MEFVKRRSGILILGLIVIQLLLILAMVNGYAQSENATAVTGRVIRFFGTAHIQVSGSDQWRGVNNRQRIRQGDTIRTGENSYVLVELSDRNVVKILSNAEFTFTSMTSFPERSESNLLLFFPAYDDAYRFEMDLEEGGAASVLRGLEGSSSYDLRTPVAAAGVRGTIFLSVYEPAHELSALDHFADGEKGEGGPGGTASFWCYEGSLEITGPGGEPLGTLPAGQGMRVTGGGSSSGQGLGGTQMQIFNELTEEFGSYDSANPNSLESIPQDGSSGSMPSGREGGGFNPPGYGKIIMPPPGGGNGEEVGE